MNIPDRYSHWKMAAYRRRCWNIGFVTFDRETIFRPLRISWLEHDHGQGWFADPFILSDDGKQLELLVEHYRYDDGLGRIARLVVRRAGARYQLQSIETLLQGASHFSFPNFHGEGGRVYIYPENWHSGVQPLYAYQPEGENRIAPAGTLYEAPLVDSVITQAFGRPRLLATREDDDPSGSVLGIHVSQSDDWRGPYVLETRYVFDGRVARGAGQCFWLGDRLIRVAQDNSGVYGGGLVFFEMSRDANGFHFRELARHLPRSPRYSLGLHTFNVRGNLAVVDGRGYAHPLRRLQHRLKARFGRGKRVGDPTRPTVVTRTVVRRA